jgi:hypothetical protein
VERLGRTKNPSGTDIGVLRLRWTMGTCRDITVCYYTASCYTSRDSRPPELRLDTHENLEQSRVVWSSESSDRIPPCSSTTNGSVRCISGISWKEHLRETICVTSRVISSGDVVEGTWVSIQDWVDEADGALASFESLIIDTSQNGRKDWRSCGGTTDEGRSTHVEDQDIVTDGRDIRVPTAVAVVDTATSTNVCVISGGV